MGGRALYFAILCSLIVPASFAFSADSDQFNITRAVLDVSGQTYNNTQFSGETSAGQLADGIASSSEYTVNLGMYFTTDLSPPSITIVGPTGTISSSSTTLEVTTNEFANCKYDTSDIAYDSMSNSFSTSAGTSHTQPLSGLSNGAYTYYVRCEDSLGNKNTASTTLSFTVSVSAAVEEEAVTGTGGGGGSGDIPFVTGAYSITKVEETFRVQQDQDIIFRMNGEEHRITATEIHDDYVIIVIASDPVRFRLNLGETIRVDVDQDRLYDLEIAYVQLIGEKVDLNVIALTDAIVTPAVCGNDILESGENYENCCIDAGCPFNSECTDNVCIELPPGICGDGICEPNEICPEDCEVPGEVRFTLSRDVLLATFTGLAVLILLWALAVSVPRKLKSYRHGKKLEHYVESRKDTGPRALKYTLKSLGWEERKVDRALKKSGLKPVKVKVKPEDENVEIYIRTKHKEGKSFWKIKRELVKVGWDKQLIVELINTYKQQLKKGRKK